MGDLGSGLVGAILGALLAGIVTAVYQTRHWRYTKRAEASVELARAFHGVYMGLTAANRQRLRAEHHPLLDWTPWNEALSTLTLFGSKRVIAGIDALDDAINTLAKAISAGEVPGTREGWLAAPERIAVGKSYIALLNLMRRDLALRGATIERLPILRGDLAEPAAANPS